MKPIVKAIIILIIVGIWGCREKSSPSYSEQYVKQAFDSIESFSIYRESYNFDSLESVVLSRLSNTNNNSVHRELESAIKAIDRHSYMLKKETFDQLNAGESSDVTENHFPFEGKILKNKYAFVSLDGFKGVDSTSSDNYADSLQHLIKQLYSRDPSGWIIDLRFNTGGWIYPMMAGLGPILGDGVKGYEIDSNGDTVEYYYAKNETDYLELSDSVYYFPEQLPIAVLIGKQTASAGELLALTFKGNPKTALIGEPTYGVATGLKGFFMPDSVQFAVTNSIMTDRYKQGNGGPILPELSANNDFEAFEYAYKWIEKNQ